MPKTKEVLLEEAKNLGINVEGLDYNALRAAVKKGHEAKADADAAANGSAESTQDNSQEQGGEGDKDTDANDTGDSSQDNGQEQGGEGDKAEDEDIEKEAKAAADAAYKEKKEALLALKKEGRDPAIFKKVYTDPEGRKFKFRKNAPVSMNIDGISMTLEEILENEDIMLELTSGNSSIVEQIYT